MFLKLFFAAALTRHFDFLLEIPLAHYVRGGMVCAADGRRWRNLLCLTANLHKTACFQPYRSLFRFGCLYFGEPFAMSVGANNHSPLSVSYHETTNLCSSDNEPMFINQRTYVHQPTTVSPSFAQSYASVDCGASLR